METVLEAAYGQIDASPALQAFVDTQGFGRDDRAVPEIVAAIYDAARCHLRPEDWLEGCLARQEGLHDAADTPWGRYLADRLLNYLEQQGALLRRAAALAQTQEDLGPKYGPVLQENLRQLEQLRACRTWEEIRANRIVDFGRLPPVRKPRDPDLADTVKALRKACWEGLKERQAPFALESRQLIGDLDRSYPALQGLVQLVRDLPGRTGRRKTGAGCWILGIWSTEPWSCCWAGGCRVPPGRPGRPAGGFGRLWWMSTRTPTRCRIAFFRRFPRSGAIASWWEM